MNVRSKLIGILFAIALLTSFTSAVHAEGNDSNSVPCSQRKELGCVLTTLDGVAVRYNGTDGEGDGAYDFGYKWQCVELIQRYYFEKFGYPKIWAPYYAYQTFDPDGHPSTMTAFPNGGSKVPQRGDILVFDSTLWNPYGHVALVKSVHDGQVTFVEQNVLDIGEDSLPMDWNNKIATKWPYGEVRGWLRETGGK